MNNFGYKMQELAQAQYSGLLPMGFKAETRAAGFQQLPTVWEMSERKKDLKFHHDDLKGGVLLLSAGLLVWLL